MIGLAGELIYGLLTILVEIAFRCLQPRKDYDLDAHRVLAFPGFANHVVKLRLREFGEYEFFGHDYNREAMYGDRSFHDQFRKRRRERSNIHNDNGLSKLQRHLLEWNALYDRFFELE